MIGSFPTVESLVISCSVVEQATITSSVGQESGATPASTEALTRTISPPDSTKEEQVAVRGTSVTSSSMEITSTARMHSTKTSMETQM